MHLISSLPSLKHLPHAPFPLLFSTIPLMPYTRPTSHVHLSRAFATTLGLRPVTQASATRSVLHRPSCQCAHVKGNPPQPRRPFPHVLVSTFAEVSAQKGGTHTMHHVKCIVQMHHDAPCCTTHHDTPCTMHHAPCTMHHVPSDLVTGRPSTMPWIDVC
jgi:hypothetical protein